MLSILFFAQLREQLACDKITLSLSTPMTVDQVCDALLLQHPHWAEFLTNEKLLCAINQTMAKTTQLVNNGDELALFPPVTGG